MIKNREQNILHTNIIFIKLSTMHLYQKSLKILEIYFQKELLKKFCTK